MDKMPVFNFLTTLRSEMLVLALLGSIEQQRFFQGGSDPGTAKNVSVLNCDVWDHGVFGQNSGCYYDTQGKISDFSKCCDDADGEDSTCVVVKSVCKLYKKLQTHDCQCQMFCEYGDFDWCPLKSGHIAGIAVGSVIGIAVLVVGIVVFIRYRRKNKAVEAEEAKENADEEDRPPEYRVCCYDGSPMDGYYVSQSQMVYPPMYPPMACPEPSCPSVKIGPPSYCL
jgi:hypothetical protein